MEGSKPSKTFPIHSHSFSIVISPEKVIKFLLFIVLIVSLLSDLGYFSKYVLGYGRLLGINYHFNLDREKNFATLFSAFLILIASMLLFLIAIAKIKRQCNFRYHWSFLSALFVYIALDEALQLHERLSDPIKEAWGTISWFYFAWVIPGTFLLCILVVVFFRFYLHLPKRARLDFTIAAILYIGGALVFEMIGGYYAYHNGLHNLTYGLITTLEETLELLGMSFFIFALLQYFKQNISSNIVFKLGD